MTNWDWSLLTDAEITERDEANRPYVEAEQARKRAVSACVDHEWEMHLDDDDFVVLRCTHCPAGVDDLYPDGVDLLYVEFDNGVKVDAGKHDSPVPLIVPVDVEVVLGRMWTDSGWEYHLEIQIQQRGLVRLVDVSPDGAA